MVGTSIGDLLAAVHGGKAARSATSVLPKPTSPQTTRSIGLALREIVEYFVDGALLVLGLVEREAASKAR